MRKISLRHIFVVVMILCILFCLAACGSSSSSITGTWVVKEYRLGERTYSKDNISEIFGEDFATYRNDSTMTFSSRGDIKMYSMGDTGHGTYDIDGNEISIYDEGGNFQINLLLVDQTIEVDLGDYVMIYEKK